jgi:hypothetical protein
MAKQSFWQILQPQKNVEERGTQLLLIEGELPQWQQA